MIAELPKLPRKERGQLAAAIFDLEEEADLLRDCDRRADERFRMLDMMEEWQPLSPYIVTGSSTETPRMFLKSTVFRVTKLAS